MGSQCYHLPAYGYVCSAFSFHYFKYLISLFSCVIIVFRLCALQRTICETRELESDVCDKGTQRDVHFQGRISSQLEASGAVAYIRNLCLRPLSYVCHLLTQVRVSSPYRRTCVISLHRYMS